MSDKIYLADDEKNIRNLMEAFLVQEGFEVRTFANGDDLYEGCCREVPDLVILDIMMPGTDGLSICSRLRQKIAKLPIIIVSAKDSPFDRVTGLTLGSDDYLVKPFLPLELVARVRALLRRTKVQEESRQEEKVLIYGPLSMSMEFRTARMSGEPLPLTPTEFDFLAYLVKNKGRAVGREELLKVLWKMNWQADTRAADDLVKRLRRKLRECDSPVQIITVWGFGFHLELEVSDYEKTEIDK